MSSIEFRDQPIADVTLYAEILMQVNEKGSMVISAIGPQPATTGARENLLESNSMQ
jgi:hypothetical protein